MCASNSVAFISQMLSVLSRMSSIVLFVASYTKEVPAFTLGLSFLVWSDKTVVAIDTKALRRAGVRTMYLHCLIPSAHLLEFRALMKDGAHLFESVDGWQALGDLTRLATPSGKLPRTTPVAAADLVERYPMLVPVVLTVPLKTSPA